MKKQDNKIGSKLELKSNVKTVDINALGWFDKVNGNSYFAGAITVNYGMSDSVVFNMPFQYGYGDSYLYTGLGVLVEMGLIPKCSLYELKELGVIIRSSICENRKKRELMVFND